MMTTNFENMISFKTGPGRLTASRRLIIIQDEGPRAHKWRTDARILQRSLNNQNVGKASSASVSLLQKLHRQSVKFLDRMKYFGVSPKVMEAHILGESIFHQPKR